MDGFDGVLEDFERDWAAQIYGSICRRGRFLEFSHGLCVRRALELRRGWHHLQALSDCFGGCVVVVDPCEGGGGGEGGCSGGSSIGLGLDGTSVRSKRNLLVRPRAAKHDAALSVELVEIKEVPLHRWVQKPMT